MCVKAVGIALKLSFEGMNQFIYFQTWIFTLIMVFCCVLQINYLNKVYFIFSLQDICIFEDVVSAYLYLQFPFFLLIKIENKKLN